MKAFLFDFDGTIADSNYVWKKVDEDFFKARNMSVPKDYVENISTMSFESGAIYTKEKYNLKESIEEIMKEWSVYALYEYENNVKLKPFAKKYIESLKKRGYKIGLVTASNPEFYTPVLKREGIFEFFDSFVDGTSGFRNKEYPDMYKGIADELNVDYFSCTVYEDVLKGIISAKSVGMNTVAVYDSSNKDNWVNIKECANSYIKSFDELL